MVSQLNLHTKKKTVVVTLNNVEINIGYIECGDISKRPILFVHGNPSSSYEYRNTLPFICDQSRGVAIDLPGFGRSDKDFPDYDVNFAVSVVEKFVEALNLQNLVLVLNDWGGVIGQGYANRNQNNIGGMVLFETLVEDYNALGNLTTDLENELYTAWTSLDFFDDIYVRFVEDLFYLNTATEFFLQPLDDITTALLHPFSSGDLDERFPKYKLQQCISFKNLIGEGNSLYGGCRQQASDITTIFLPWYIDVNIPKLIFFANPGLSLTVQLRNIVANNNITNLTTAEIDGIHFLSEDSPHRFGAVLSRWLHDTQLATVDY